MYKNIFFDLDGTIVDSREGIVNGYIYMLNYYNIEVQDQSTLEQFIGPPIEDILRDYYKINPKQIKDGIKKYREFYSKTGVWQTKPYNGIIELIRDLKKDGKNVILATSKPEVFAKQILEKYEIINCFRFVGGATLDGTRNEKKEVISYAIKNVEGINHENSIMVGDRNYDILGAKANNLKSIGVTYGFGTRKELKTAGADYIAEDMDELRKILFQ